MSNVDQGAFAKLLHRFRPVQAVFLFVGFVIFALGLARGFHLSNRPMMIGVCVMSCGITGQYWSAPKYDDLFTGEVFIKGGVRWGRIFLGTIFAVIAVVSAYWAYVSN